MELSLKLLNNYVKVDDLDPAYVADKLTRIGHEVEGMHNLCTGSDLVVGYVHECVDHPDSDHLHVCQVEVKPGVMSQIVCGAPNCKAGIKVIVAMPGCVLEGGTISRGVIRGQESNGMICSIRELGLNSRFLREEDSAGIHILPEDAPIGVEALEYMGMKDTVLEIGLTANRADCMAVSSIAYDAAAALERTVTIPEIPALENKASDISIKIETPMCSYFSAKLVKGVETHESPEWLRNYLMASGMKPINNVVDISNFVMIETGQPIHMYDYDKLVKKEFVIKQGFTNKEVLLDGNEYQLEADDVVVAVDGVLGCLAGVYGGKRVEVDENTKNIVIEVATFDGPTLRSTARRLNLLTDASQHYIKGALNTANSKYVSDRCAALLVELADAKEVYETVASDYTYEPKVVTVTTSHVNKLLGTTITTEEVADVFTRLAFDYKQEGELFTVNVPSYRNDISMSADLIEEVARIYGLDNLPSTLPLMEATTGRFTDKQMKERTIRHILIDNGLNEAITYTLTSRDNVEDFSKYLTNEAIALAMPLGEERSVVRKSVIPQLLTAINYNGTRGFKDMGLFEVANIYATNEEIDVLGIACTGTYYSNPWQGINQKYDFYVVKGFVEKIIASVGINESRIMIDRYVDKDKYYHPGRTATISVDRKVVAYIGQIHPNMEKKYDVKNVYVAEINLDALYAVKTGNMKYKEIPVYPSVLRDLALVVDKDVPARDIVNAAKNGGKRLLKNVNIFDAYEGEHIEAGKKSIAISLEFQDEKKTLSEDEINAAMDKVLKSLAKATGATLRQ